MTIIATIILVAYLAYAYCKVGIPYCLSDTAYTVGKGIFASAMIAVAACLWLPMMETTEEWWQFLVFLSFAGIAILAVSPYKDSDFNYKLHYVGTYIAMVAVLSLWAARGAWVVPIATISAGLALRAITDKWLLWVELMMFALAITYTIN
jgi:hypothetical protein